MIYSRFLIDNVWYKPRNHVPIKDYYYHHLNLTTHKNFEIQVSRHQPDTILEIGLDLRWKGLDHAGPELDINVLGFKLIMRIYDGRHWNYDDHRWYTQEETQAQAAEWATK